MVKSNFEIFEISPMNYKYFIFIHFVYIYFYPYFIIYFLTSRYTYVRKLLESDACSTQEPGEG